jgi:uncharacterized protein
MTVAAIATLLGGVLLGYTGQRSRMCFVGAFRDLLAVGDRYRLKGFLAFVATILVLRPLLPVLIGTDQEIIRPFVFDGLTVGLVAVTVVAGAAIGFASTLANGCPFRQHVLAAQGAVSSVWYLVGFFAGAFAYHFWVAPEIARFI